MPTQHVVVDGSNIATETRQLPSLAQLESALEELRKDFPDSEVTVVVDATFAHRIDPSELARYEEAARRGELVSPPAGAIGRGDAFLLRIAEKVDGTVLSNDSFQEFHGEHPWLFERGRLLGATPVPGVGWIFVPRTPVRGPKSRTAVRDAHRAKELVTEAIAEATREAEDPEAIDEAAEPKTRRSRSRRPAVTPQAVNDPMTFITFIAEHKLGDEIEAEVESFTSHGAVIFYGDVRCYAPLANLAVPPPRSARELLRRGEKRTFVITALDPYRRGIELALPGVGVVSGRPSEETVEAEVRLARRPRRTAATPAALSSDGVPPSSGQLEVPAGELDGGEEGRAALAAGEVPSTPSSTAATRAATRRRGSRTPAPSAASPSTAGAESAESVVPEASAAVPSKTSAPRRSPKKAAEQSAAPARAAAPRRRTPAATDAAEHRDAKPAAASKPSADEKSARPAARRSRASTARPPTTATGSATPGAENAPAASEKEPSAPTVRRTRRASKALDAAPAVVLQTAPSAIAAPSPAELKSAPASSSPTTSRSPTTRARRAKAGAKAVSSDVPITPTRRRGEAPKDSATPGGGPT